MKPIVVVENIRKKFSLNSNQHLSYGITDLLDELLGRTRNTNLRKDEFWAVDDISFYLNPGDCFALVGRNGSGKSTMLKMLNGIIKPDAGTIIIDGSVQALINLGAGFSPRLSGRENIYNTAAIKGLNRQQTRQIIDEIIEFSELEEFIDSPVETYSSGMYARLGFSVAVHLKPDILLIDEILSVGDYAFQNKCFIKMHEIKKRGVTIIMVSHSFTHINQLCEQALWLEKGKLMQIGRAKDITKAYLHFMDERTVDASRKELHQLKKEVLAESRKKTLQSLYGPIYSDWEHIEDLEFHFKVRGSESDIVRLHDRIEIEYSFLLKREVTDMNISLVFLRKDGLWLTTISTLNGDLVKDIHNGRVHCRVEIEDFYFNPGNYVLVMPIHEGKSYLYRHVVKEFVVVTGERFSWHLSDLKYRYEVILDGVPVLVDTNMNFDKEDEAGETSGLLQTDMSQLNFSYEVSMGTVKVRQTGSSKWEWETYSEAIGRIFIPHGLEVMLVVSTVAADRLFLLKSVDPHALYALHLARLPINDEEFTHIRHLKGLKTLDIRETNLTDRSIDILKELTELRSVVLPSSISEDGLIELQKALPKCKVTQ